MSLTALYVEDCKSVEWIESLWIEAADFSGRVKHSLIANTEVEWNNERHNSVTTEDIESMAASKLRFVLYKKNLHDCVLQIAEKWVNL